MHARTLSIGVGTAITAVFLAIGSPAFAAGNTSNNASASTTPSASSANTTVEKEVAAPAALSTSIAPKTEVKAATVATTIPSVSTAPAPAVKVAAQVVPATVSSAAVVPAAAAAAPVVVKAAVVPVAPAMSVAPATAKNVVAVGFDVTLAVTNDPVSVTAYGTTRSLYVKTGAVTCVSPDIWNGAVSSYSQDVAVSCDGTPVPGTYTAYVDYGVRPASVVGATFALTIPKPVVVCQSDVKGLSATWSYTNTTITYNVSLPKPACADIKVAYGDAYDVPDTYDGNGWGSSAAPQPYIPDARATLTIKKGETVFTTTKSFAVALVCGVNYIQGDIYTGPQQDIVTYPKGSNGWLVGDIFKVVKTCTNDASAEVKVNPPTCTANGSAEVANLKFAVLVGTLDQTVGTHKATFKSTDTHLFANGTDTLKVSYTVTAKVTGEQCWAKDATASVNVSSPTCTVNGVASVTGLLNATLVGVLDQTVGTHDATFKSVEGHFFANGKDTLVVSYTVTAKVTTGCVTTSVETIPNLGGPSLQALAIGLGLGLGGLGLGALLLVVAWRSRKGMPA